MPKISQELSELMSGMISEMQIYEMHFASKFFKNFFFPENIATCLKSYEKASHEAKINIALELYKTIPTLSFLTKVTFSCLHDFTHSNFFANLELLKSQGFLQEEREKIEFEWLATHANTQAVALAVSMYKNQNIFLYPTKDLHFRLICSHKDARGVAYLLARLKKNGALNGENSALIYQLLNHYLPLIESPRQLVEVIETLNVASLLGDVLIQDNLENLERNYEILFGDNEIKNLWLKIPKELINDAFLNHIFAICDTHKDKPYLAAQEFKKFILSHFPRPQPLLVDALIPLLNKGEYTQSLSHELMAQFEYVFRHFTPELEIKDPVLFANLHALSLNLHIQMQQLQELTNHVEVNYILPNAQSIAPNLSIFRHDTLISNHEAQSKTPPILEPLSEVDEEEEAMFKLYL